MTVAEKMGGMPALAASFVVLTGVLGGVIAGPIFKLLKVDSAPARGFLFRSCVSRNRNLSSIPNPVKRAGTYANLAIGLTGLVTALIAPVLLPVLLMPFE